MTPAAKFLCFRYSYLKLLMLSTLLVSGGRYEQHVKYGSRSKCTSVHMRSIVSDIAINDTLGAYPFNTNIRIPFLYCIERSRCASFLQQYSSACSFALVFTLFPELRWLVIYGFSELWVNIMIWARCVVSAGQGAQLRKFACIRRQRELWAWLQQDPVS